MSITLEQVDQVRERTGVNYKEAKAALERAGGDVVEAIVFLEGSEEHSTYTTSTEQPNAFSQFGEDLSKFFKDIIHKGNVNRISIEKDGRRILDLPVAAGAFGAVFFAPATVISIIIAFATGCEMSIVKEDGEVINVKDVTKETLDSVREQFDKEKIEETVEEVKEDIKDTVDSFKKEAQDLYEEVKSDDHHNQQ